MGKKRRMESGLERLDMALSWAADGYIEPDQVPKLALGSDLALRNRSKFAVNGQTAKNCAVRNTG
jgi:hypothetical protein